jgi:P-type Mg2+ transporter
MIKIKDKNKSYFKQMDYFKKISTIDDNQKLFNQVESNYCGINDELRLQKIKKSGLNQIEKQTYRWYEKILEIICSPFIIILIIISSWYLFQYFIIENEISNLLGFIIIFSMILFSIIINFIQDFGVYKTAKKLKQMVKTTASVYNNQHENENQDCNKNCKKNIFDLTFISKNTKEENIQDLVVGDIIYLSAGDMIPADVRILVAKDLFINESTLTGESIPVEKYSQPDKIDILKNQQTVIFKLKNICFMGTNVVSGSAIAIIISTGKNTIFGNIAKSILVKRVDNNFEKNIKNISQLIVVLTLLVTPLIFGLRIIKNDSIAFAFLYTISAVVGLIPEVLPLIISICLARGSLKMAKKETIVKNLTSMQNFGAVNILCSDKTGTLTEDKIELIKNINLNGKNDDLVLKLIYLNSFFQTGLKNTIDKTVIEHIHLHHHELKEIKYQKIDEIPFDFSRRRLSIVIKKEEEDKVTLICKGALKEVLKTCSYYHENDKTYQLTNEIKTKIIEKHNYLNSKGYRILVIAYKNSEIKNVYNINDEKDLIFVGFSLFMDKIKDSTKKTIKSLKKHGVDVKILTGDNEIVTSAICEKVGIKSGLPLLGSEIDKLNDNELAKLSAERVIFAKLNPLQKSRIVLALKSKNENVVAFLGDGINDAIALHNADIGISVNNASDIAKETSDIIILKRSLDVLENAIMEGRKTYINIIKYIKITMTSQFGNIFSLLIASLWLPIVPMLPIQMLFQNLLYDTAQTLIAWDKIDAEQIKKPLKWKQKNMFSFVFWNAPVSSLFDIITFAVSGYLFGFLNENSYNKFYTSWFIVGTLTQILIVHAMRTKKIPFFQSRASWQLNISTLITIIITIMLTWKGKWLFLEPLNFTFYLFVFGLIIFYFLISYLVKIIYIHFYKEWL